MRARIVSSAINDQAALAAAAPWRGGPAPGRPGVLVQKLGSPGHPAFGKRLGEHPRIARLDAKGWLARA